MKIDLTCPVELWHFKMPTAEDPVCMVQLYNLSEKTVVSIQACYLCYDEEGDQTARHVERVQGLSAPTHCAFEMSVEVEEGVNAAGMELLIEKVWFEDGTIWRRGLTQMTDYALPAPPDPKRLAILQQIAGADATGYPSDQGSVWVCVCGRPNPSAFDTCSRCQRDKHAVFTACNEGAIEKIYYDQESAEEEKQRAIRQQEEEKERQAAEKEKKRRQRSKNILTALIAIVVLAAAAYGIIFHLWPWYRYTNAVRDLNNLSYASAPPCRETPIIPSRQPRGASWPWAITRIPP